MMKISYYPGCTLKTKALNLEESAKAALAALDVELEELERWNCCGAVFSLADDDLLHLLAPVRDLIRVTEMGRDELVTTCSMCYNTLARANEVMRDDEEKRFTINSFMEEEPDYQGQVKVMHLLTFLKDRIGWDAIKSKVQTPLEGLRIAPYYGCTLVRPESISIDAKEKRTLFEEFIETMGGESVPFPADTDCCSSYQIISNPEAAMEGAANVLESAAKWEIDVLAMSCPLCEFNLGRKQDMIRKTREGLKEIPTIYFTQLLAIALGLDKDVCRFELNSRRVTDLLEKKGLLGRAS
ncbi:CoB--CoM heterodisulfide reductase iron-sulfur subunit B family protein [Acidobacteriota bacterium]